MHKKFDIEQAFIKNGFKKKIEKRYLFALNVKQCMILIMLKK